MLQLEVIRKECQSFRCFHPAPAFRWSERCPRTRKKQTGARLAGELPPTPCPLPGQAGRGRRSALIPLALGHCVQLLLLLVSQATLPVACPHQGSRCWCLPLVPTTSGRATWPDCVPASRRSLSPPPSPSHQRSTRSTCLPTWPGTVDDQMSSQAARQPALLCSLGPLHSDAVEPRSREISRVLVVILWAHSGFLSLNTLGKGLL